MVRIIPFGVLLKLWASGQSDDFLLLLLGLTADVHTFCMLSIFCLDKLNHFVFMPQISIRVVCVNGKHPDIRYSGYVQSVRDARCLSVQGSF